MCLCLSKNKASPLYLDTPSTSTHHFCDASFGFSQLDFILDGSHVWILPHRKIIPKYDCLLIFLQIYLEVVLGLIL